MSFVTTLLAETEHVSLPMPTWAYGLIALVIFIALGVTLWTYRDVSNRHSEKAPWRAVSEWKCPLLPQSRTRHRR